MDAPQSTTSSSSSSSSNDTSSTANTAIAPIDGQTLHERLSFAKKVSDHYSTIGAYIENKRKTLRVQFAENIPSTSHVLNGCVLWFNGRVEPPTDVMREIVYSNGGAVENVLVPGVTHIIADQLPNTKVKEFRSSRTPSVVSAWVHDSIAAGRLLDCGDYVTPELREKGQKNVAKYFSSQPRDSTTNSITSTQNLSSSTSPSRFVPRKMAAPSAKHYARITNFGSQATGTAAVLSTSSAASLLTGQQRDLRSIQTPPRASAAPRLAITESPSRSERGSATVDQESDSELEAALAAMQQYNEEEAESMNLADQGPVSGRKDVDFINEESLATSEHSLHSLGDDDSMRDTDEAGEPGEPGALISPILGNFKHNATRNVGRPPRSTLTDPNFVSSYFEASRLHFLGSFKEHLNTIWSSLLSVRPIYPSPNTKLPEAGVTKSSGFKIGNPSSKERVLLHVDMDCFFASVSLRDRPELKGAPVAVSHTRSQTANSTGEISSCNYAARSLGVRATMSIGRATELCPQLVVLDYDFALYAKVSEQVYRCFFAITHHVQAVSCDEAYLELPSWADGHTIALDLQRSIYEATQCTASAGVGPNKLIARLATKLAKPNGVRYLRGGEEVSKHLLPLPVAELPGVGWSIDQRLAQMSVTTCGELQAVPMHMLKQQFGEKNGETLYNACRGIDNRPIETNRQRKSLGVDLNYGIRFVERRQVDTFVHQVAAEVVRRLRGGRLRGRTIIVHAKKRRADAPVEPPHKFLGHGVCDNFSKSRPVQTPIDGNADNVPILGHYALDLYNSFQIPPDWLRGFGIHIGRLESDPSSFDAQGRRVGDGAKSSRVVNLTTLFKQQHSKSTSAVDQQAVDEAGASTAGAEPTSEPTALKLSELTDDMLYDLAEQLSQQEREQQAAVHIAADGDMNESIALSDYEAAIGIAATQSTALVEPDSMSKEDDVVKPDAPSKASAALLAQIQSSLIERLAAAGSHAASAALAALSVEQMASLQVTSAIPNQPILIVLPIPLPAATESRIPRDMETDVPSAPTVQGPGVMTGSSNSEGTNSGGIAVTDLPPLASLDKATVLELPLDIRKELAAAYKKLSAIQGQDSQPAAQRAEIPSAVPTVVPAPRSTEKVPTNWSYRVTAADKPPTPTVSRAPSSTRPQRAQSAMNGLSLTSLPPASEVDPDFLAALPPDLRAEYTQGYAQLKRNAEFDARERKQKKRQKLLGSAEAPRRVPSDSRNSNTRSSRRTSLRVKQPRNITSHFKALVIPQPHQAVPQVSVHSEEIVMQHEVLSPQPDTEPDSPDFDVPVLPLMQGLQPTILEEVEEEEIIELSDSDVTTDMPAITTIDIRQEVVQSPTAPTDPVSLHFKAESQRELAQTLPQWLTVVGDEASEDNAALLSAFCNQQLSIHRNMPVVVTLLRALRRHATVHSTWTYAFNTLLKEVQHNVQSLYCSKLSMQKLQDKL